MFNFPDSLNTVYEIRDEGTQTRYFFVGKDTGFSPPKSKSLANYTTKIINHSITSMDTISTIKKKIVTFIDDSITHYQICLWTEFIPKSVSLLLIQRLISGYGSDNIDLPYLKIENGTLKKLKMNLGCELQINNKVKILNPDPRVLAKESEETLENINPFLSG